MSASSLLTSDPLPETDSVPSSTRITLAEPEVQKLGLQDPKPGQKIAIEGTATIAAVSAGETGRELVLEIMDLVEKRDTQDSSRTTVLYPMGNS